MALNNVSLVLAGAVAHFATGWVLNSDLLLGQYWKKDDSKKCDLSKDMRINMAAQFAASVALSVATCILLYMAQKHQAPVAPADAMSKLMALFFTPSQSPKSFMCGFRAVTFIWAGFIIPTSVGEVIWCEHNWKFWMLEMGMELAGLLAIAATVIFLA